MLARHHVGLNKKAVSNIIVTVILVVLVFTSVLIFWTAMKKIILTSPAEKASCLELMNEISIKRACYLNDDEILVEVDRGFDSQEILKLRFGLGEAVWELTGKKCTDVKMGEGGQYGGYCSIVDEGQKLSYVFDVTGLEGVNRVSLAAGGKELCSIAEKKVSENC